MDVAAGSRGVTHPRDAAEWLPQATAVLVTATVLALAAAALLDRPPPVADRGQARMVLRFLERAAAPVPSTPGVTRVVAPASVPSRARVPASPGVTAPEQPPAPRQGSTSTSATLYDANGQVRLPANVAVDPLDPGDTAPPGMTNERALRRARQLMERPKALPYEPTRFARDWASDGTLGDVAAQAIGRQMKKLTRVIFGDDIQAAVARPPPDVRFNPALHEQPSDLGSAATGDAYKAAPIPAEKAPDLNGTASAVIRAAIGEVEARHRGCSAAQLRDALGIVLPHLQELQRVERLAADGADPVMAEHSLPAAADSAYDLARRALWYSHRQLQQMRCGG